MLRAALVLFAVLLNSCATATRAPAAVQNPTNKDTFFGTKGSVPLYYIRVSRWQPGLSMPGPLSQKLSQEDSLVSEGATLEVFRLENPADEQYCPNNQVKGQQPLVTIPNFEISSSGNATANTPKSSYKLKFKRDSGGGIPTLFGMRELVLKSMWNDVSQTREALAWHLFAKAGVPASRQTYARFCMTSDESSNFDHYAYFGLFTMIEQIDSAFLEERFHGNSQGNLYKAYWAKIGDLGPADLTYVAGDETGVRLRQQPQEDLRTYRLKTKHSKSEKSLDSYSDLGRFLQILNGRDIANQPNDSYFASAAYQQKMLSTFNVKSFLRWAAANTLLGAWDNYWAIPQNYFVYNTQSKESHMTQPAFEWIPWDYDNVLGSSFVNVDWVNADIVNWEKTGVEVARFERAKGENVPDTHLPLLNNLLKNRANMAFYLDELEFLLDRFYTLDYLGNYFEEIWKVIGPSAYLEGRRDNHPFEQEQDQPPHTGRLFTNRQVSENGHHGQTFARDGRILIGVKEYIQSRSRAVRTQIQNLRTQLSLPRGSSGEPTLK